MASDPTVFLQDMLRAARRLRTFIDGHSFDTFQSSELTRAAVERQFEIIGEALRHLLENHPNLREEFPDARKIIALRNIIIHGYASVEHRVLWDVAQDQLPVLMRRIEQLIASLDSDS